MAEIWYCPNPKCPYRVLHREAYYSEFPGICPFCREYLKEEK